MSSNSEEIKATLDQSIADTAILLDKDLFLLRLLKQNGAATTIPDSIKGNVYAIAVTPRSRFLCWHECWHLLFLPMKVPILPLAQAA